MTADCDVVKRKFVIENNKNAKAKLSQEEWRGLSVSQYYTTSTGTFAKTQLNDHNVDIGILFTIFSALTNLCLLAYAVYHSSVRLSTY